MRRCLFVNMVAFWNLDLLLMQIADNSNCAITWKNNVAMSIFLVLWLRYHYVWVFGADFSCCKIFCWVLQNTLQWRHNERDGVSNDVIKWKPFRVTGPLWRESPSHRWIPLTKASDMELWCLPRSAHEQTVNQTPETPAILDAIVPIMTSL